MEDGSKLKFMSGVPANEKWWFWGFIVFLLWSVGPGIEIFARPVFIGPLPMLYWHELASWIVSIWLCYMAGYKLKCTQVTDIEKELMEKVAVAEKELIAKLAAQEGIQKSA